MPRPDFRHTQKGRPTPPGAPYKEYYILLPARRAMRATGSPLGSIDARTQPSRSIEANSVPHIRVQILLSIRNQHTGMPAFRALFEL
jgi:hypothetical protein